MEQRLTAIFALDMMAYSRLMEADELDTILRHKSHRDDLIDRAIADNGGRIVKEMGDGLLAEFSSVAGAVGCAVEIQRALPAREAGVAADKQILYRIGINLGDIVDDGNEVYGDGINVAARLEQLADPGGICISGTAYETLRTALNVSFTPLGPMSVKNISRPIHAYRVDLDGPGEGGKAAQATVPVGRRRRLTLIALLLVGAVALLALGFAYRDDLVSAFGGAEKSQSEAPLSIAMLPFRDLSERDGSSYVSAGITEDLASEVSARADVLFMTLNAPARNDAEFEKARQMVGGLGADYLLSGTVDRDDTGLMIRVALKVSSDPGTLFERSYKRDKDALASLGRDISGDIIAALPGVRLRTQDTADPGFHFPSPVAYDLLLQGNAELARFNPASLQAAQALYQRSAEADPNYTRPQANIAFVMALTVAFGWTNDPEALARQATEIADAALQSDPTVHQAYLAKGLVTRSQRRYDLAMLNFEKAIEIAPSNADAYAMVALTHVFSGEPERGLSFIEQAIMLNPDHPFHYLFTKGVALFNLEDFEAAAELFEVALVRNPEFLPARLAYVSALSHLGRKQDAIWEMEEVLVRQPSFTLLREQVRTPYANTNDTLRYIQGLRAAMDEP